MTTIWLQPPVLNSKPIEVEYTRETIVPLMVQGHRQITAEEAASLLNPAPAPTVADALGPQPAVSKIWLQPPNGGKPIEVQAVPDILTPYMEQGYTECPAPKA